jgi:hypothetical protein
MRTDHLPVILVIEGLASAECRCGWRGGTFADVADANVSWLDHMVRVVGAVR